MKPGNPHLTLNLRGQEGWADIILTPHPQSLSPLRGEGSRDWTRQGTFGVQRVNARNFRGNLTLALSPPIGWERRGNPPSPRLRRTGSRRMAAVARKSGRMRQVQGSKARIIRGILSPLRGEGSRDWTRQGTFGVQRVNARNFRGNLTLALSPPIGWERRGNPPSPRLRRTGSRRMAAVARKSGRMRQVQGSKARIIRGILSPLRGEGSRDWTRQGTFGVQRVNARNFRGNLTLALSPPIGWERRGNPPSPRLRRTGSRRMAAVARKSGRIRQVYCPVRSLKKDC